LRAWLANHQESNFLCFDNLGLSGAQPDDLYTRTSDSSGAELTALCPDGTSTSTINISEVGKLHLAINGRFVLNPSQNPDFANMTPIRWVEARLPKRLFVQIGHNNGLYSIGADAGPAKLNFTQDNDNGQSFFDSFKVIAEAVAALPADVQSIVVILLPKVGAARQSQTYRQHAAERICRQLCAVFSTSKTLLSGVLLAGVDQQIAAANANLQQIFTSAAQATNQTGRLKFLDTFQLFESIDYKNSLDRAKRIAIDQDNLLDNEYIAGGLIPQVPFPPGDPRLRK
jgi:hypothetical protein